MSRGKYAIIYVTVRISLALPTFRQTERKPCTCYTRRIFPFAIFRCPPFYSVRSRVKYGWFARLNASIEANVSYKDMRGPPVFGTVSLCAWSSHCCTLNHTCRGGSTLLTLRDLLPISTKRGIQNFVARDQ